MYPPRAFADEVEDEAAEGVWGYLIPLDDKVKDALVLRKRDSCDDDTTSSSKSIPKKGVASQAKNFSLKQQPSRRPGGYLVGRHPECGKYYLDNLHGTSLLRYLRPGSQYTHGV